MEKLKKYRLIKTYPGSPVLGFEVEKIGASIYVGGSGNTFQIRKEYIEYHSEFWEEVIEKDYEILCIKHKKSKCFYRNSINLRNLNLYDIHSVKRLSDGEVFTVGDRINHYGEYAKNEFSTKTYTLKEIYFIEENKLTFYVGKSFNLGAISASKYKLPLFTTEDGVDIFKNTKFWYIDNFIIKTYITREFSEIESSYKKFSTKEKAEEYILLNKPCICLKDLIEAFFPKDYNFNNRKSEGAIEDISVNLLISLFKLKLKEK